MNAENTIDTPPPLEAAAETPMAVVGFRLEMPGMAAVPPESESLALLLAHSVRAELRAKGLICEAQADVAPSAEVCFLLGQSAFYCVTVFDRDEGLLTVCNTLSKLKLLRFAEVGWMENEGEWHTFFPQGSPLPFRRHIDEMVKGFLTPKSYSAERLQARMEAYAAQRSKPSPPPA